MTADCMVAELCPGYWGLWGQPASLNLPLSCGSCHAQAVHRRKSVCGSEMRSEGLKGFFQVGSRDDSCFLMHSGVVTGKGPTPGGLTSICLPVSSGWAQEGCMGSPQQQEAFSSSFLSLSQYVGLCPSVVNFVLKCWEYFFTIVSALHLVTLLIP